MRRVLFPVVALTVGLVAYAMVSASIVTADTPVTVLDADRVLLLLPVSPPVERVVSDLRAELLVMAREESDVRVVEALERTARDDDLLRRVATTPVDMFNTNQAIATATPIFDVSLSRERVVITAITVELVPGYGSTAGSRDHEDGHALINERVARRCAADALEYSVSQGYQGKALAAAISRFINLAADPVHARYHVFVGNASYGQHIGYADQALREVDGCDFSRSMSP